MKKVFNLLYKVVLSAFVLYGYNFIAVNFNAVVPINFFTLLLVFFLGAPGMVGLVLFRILVL